MSMSELHSLADVACSFYRRCTLSYHSDGGCVWCHIHQKKGCFTPPLDVIAWWLSHRSFYPTEDDVIDVPAWCLPYLLDDVVKLWGHDVGTGCLSCIQIGDALCVTDDFEELSCDDADIGRRWLCHRWRCRGLMSWYLSRMSRTHPHTWWWGSSHRWLWNVRRWWGRDSWRQVSC